ncbi:MAG: KH domain-containing protein [Myxococcota bacterium]
MSVPDNVEKIEIEGRDLKRAIAGAAEELGLHPAQVDYKLDMSHFRSTTGVSVARDTVKIVAWKSERDAPAEGVEPEAKEEEEKPRKRKPRKKPDAEESESTDGVAADADDAEEKPKRKRRTRKKSDDGESAAAESDKPEQLRGAEAETTEASTFAQGWFEKLLELMGVEGQVVGTGNDQRVHLAIQAERAGRIVGKRGATLGAIRHLLSLALERRFGGLTVDVDVDGDRERKKTSDRPERRDRRDRDRDRDRDDRGGRGRRGGRDRGGRDRGGRGPKGKYDEDKLRALARRAAEKAVETGKTFTINLQLNSYDRRVVHLEISEIDGVDSHSEEREVDGQTLKFVQVVPDGD